MCFFNFIFVMLMEPFIYVNICMVHNLVNVRHFIIVSSPRYRLMEDVYMRSLLTVGFLEI